jgi:integrase/recombinase XerD
VKERVYLTDTEAQRLFDAIFHPLIRVAAMTMYYAGLRINECIKLTLDDVDFYQNSITVIKDKEEHTRVIPINYKLREALMECLDNQAITENSGNFFATKTGTLSPNYTNFILRQATKVAGLNKVITCHILRHSFASNLVSKGADIGQVQKLLGHTDLKTTEIYLHTNMDELKKTIDLIT